MKDKHILNITNLLLITGGILVLVGAAFRVFHWTYGKEILHAGLMLEALSFAGVLIYAIKKHI